MNCFRAFVRVVPGVFIVAWAIAAILATSPASSQTPASCADTAQSELTTIIHRIYDQAVHGRNEASAVKRIGRSTRLARAVASGRPATVRAELAKLIKSQITRISVFTPKGRIAQMGSIPSYAPVRGQIVLSNRQVGTYVLSVASDASFSSLVHNLTGGSARFARGAAHSARSFPATVYPSGNANVAISLPAAPPSVCAAATADTQLNTIGLVAARVMNQEVHSREAASTLKYVEGNMAFRNAVAAGNRVAVRSAIVGFFKYPRFHIVRVRAWKGTRLINDVGGPYVLSPASGVIRGPSGRVVGRFMLAIQDDTGYIKLVHLFTGVDVVLHTNRGTVPGSNLEPGPPFTAGLSTTTYNGHTYRAFGLTGTMFPTGTLQVSLLQAG